MTDALKCNRLRSALLELVECKALKDRRDGSTDQAVWVALDKEYRMRKPLAWFAATKALED